jgi:hypothetical protein
MPKLKPSPGKVELQSPIMDEFQRWLCYELVNYKEWNHDLIEGGMKGAHRWSFKTKWWIISFDGRRVIVESEQPIVSLRKGLLIRMGSGRLELT